MNALDIDTLDYPYYCIECGASSNSIICDICKERIGAEVIKPNKTKGLAIKTGERTLHSSNIKRFILGGNAIFTLHNSVRGTHLTFKVQVCRNTPELFFVSVLTGPDNWSNYSYLGVIREGIYWHGAKSKITETALSAVSFKWFWSNIDRLPQALQVLHEGKCGRCGRKLTVPESISTGFGPECKGKI